MDLTLAGGAALTVACPLGVPCGNANPDPCICGRPDSDPSARAACDVEKSCQAKGLEFNFDWSTPACLSPDMSIAPDDAGSGYDGNAHSG